MGQAAPLPSCNCQNVSADQEQRVLSDVDSHSVLLHRLDDLYCCGPTSPPPAPKFFEIFLDKRQGGRLGINVDRREGTTLTIDGISDGLVHEWNMRNPVQDVLAGDRVIEVNGDKGFKGELFHDREVMKGDRIVEVNGERGSADALVDACKQSGILRIRLMRNAPTTVTRYYSSCGLAPKVFDVVLDKSLGASLGVSVDHRDNISLRIESIDGGLFAKWNVLNPDHTVLVGDRIAQVNGISGDVVDIIEECKKQECLRMKIVRPQTMFDCGAEEAL